MPGRENHTREGKKKTCFPEIPRTLSERTGLATLRKVPHFPVEWTSDGSYIVKEAF